MPQHPQLSAIRTKIQTCWDKASDLEAQYIENSTALVNEVLGTSHKYYELEFGDWDCPDPEGDGRLHEPHSPTGRCVYVPEADPSRDRCLFCGLPQERK